MWKKFYKKSKEQNGKTKKYLYMIYMVRHLRHLRHLRHFPRCGDVKSWQNIIIQMCHVPGCKILNHINLYQKTVFFDHRILKKYHFYPYFCIFFVLKWRKWRKWRIYYCMWKKFIKIYRVEWKNKKNIYI